VQPKLTVPVKPLMALAEMVVVPESPAAAITKLLGDAPVLKSAVPLEMVIVIGAEVEPT
jgi:hypothetical protein